MTTPSNGKNQQELQFLFQTGKTPSGQDFADFINSNFNLHEEEIIINNKILTIKSQNLQIKSSNQETTFLTVDNNSFTINDLSDLVVRNNLTADNLTTNNLTITENLSATSLTIDNLTTTENLSATNLTTDNLTTDNLTTTNLITTKDLSATNLTTTNLTANINSLTTCGDERKPIQIQTFLVSTNPCCIEYDNTWVCFLGGFCSNNTGPDSPNQIFVNLSLNSSDKWEIVVSNLPTNGSNGSLDLSVTVVAIHQSIGEVIMI